MDDKRLVKASKYLSRHLRHEPERIGLTLEPGGWVAVDDLLAALKRQRFALTADELDEVVARNDKQRFSFDDSGTRIRATQGHSVELDLELAPVEPPDVLFHGTSEHTAEAIIRDGLHAMGRNHVHLSGDVDTAKRVGGRHGPPVVFQVASGAMFADGYDLFCTDNLVWLVDEVPPKYLTPLWGRRA